MTGHEILGKKIGVVGLGRIGKEVVKRAVAFEMPVMGFDLYWPDEFAEKHGIEKADDLESLLIECDIISLHTNLTDQTRNLICESSIEKMKDGVVIVNCARGEDRQLRRHANGIGER